MTRALPFTTVLVSYKSEETECCGIIGYLGKDKIASEVISQGINLLQNRGYDSSGVATLHEGTLRVSKMTSDFQGGVDCIEEI